MHAMTSDELSEILATKEGVEKLLSILDRILEALEQREELLACMKDLMVQCGHEDWLEVEQAKEAIARAATP